MFVAWLFIMALACFVVGIGDFSLGWLCAAVVFLAVGIYASRQLRREVEDEEDEGVSLGFFGKSIVLMVVAMMAIFWFQFSS